MTYPWLDRRRLSNTAYLYLRHIGPGESERQIPIAWKIDQGPQLIIDLDAQGHVLGIEFLDADGLLGAPQEEE